MRKLVYVTGMGGPSVLSLNGEYLKGSISPVIRTRIVNGMSYNVASFSHFTRIPQAFYGPENTDWKYLMSKEL